MDNTSNAITAGNPQWWNDSHSSAWERIKAALARDWAQTKADFTMAGGQELNQNVADTVKQAAGTTPVPPTDTANVKPGEPKKESYEAAEPALRYGHGAASQFGSYKDWTTQLESTLEKEWNNLKSGREWAAAKEHVRYGWDVARGKVAIGRVTPPGKA